MAFRQLIVTAGLGAPIVGESSLPLDGILYYYAVRETSNQPQIVSLRTPPPVGLPLLVCNDGDDWFYGCSFANWEQPSVSGQDNWVKRVDVDDAIKCVGEGSVDISKGEFKGYHQPIYYKFSTSIKWYVIGDPTWIAQTLSRIHTIGTKRETGWGAILTWDVVEITDVLWDENGPHMHRAIPVSYYVDRGKPYPFNATAHRSFRPPYWHPDNMGLAVWDTENAT
jgi:CRISPR type IV-associated protein Csf3